MKTFNEFYLHYMMEHSHPTTRRLHTFAQTTVVIQSLVCFVLGYPWFVPLWISFGYLVSWFSHWKYEKNKPTTFSNPMWSLRAGRYMLRAILRGDINLTGHAYDMFENGYLKRIADGIPSQEET
jgi:hypothetical protein